MPKLSIHLTAPALPVTVAPAPINAKGRWSVAVQETFLAARFEDAEGNLLGFALGGQAPSVRSALTKLLPAILPPVQAEITVENL